jgi:DUF1680 family protein
LYLYSGMADAARLTGDDTLLAACEKIWNNIITRQMYITGGIGQTVHGEAFTFDYDLPNDTAYTETCAAIGLAFFARRLASIAPRGVYADVLERALYNGIISGMSLDGTAFFYVNPLEVLPESCLKDQSRRHVKFERQKWFSCACCPPNLARIIASLGSYVHSANNDSVFTHLFAGGEANFSIRGKKVSVKTETNYPWEGRVDIGFRVEDGFDAGKTGGAEFTYGFRIPAWCLSRSITLNGEEYPCTIKDGYARMTREWQSGDAIKIIFDMPVTFMESNPHVRENSGRIAVTRGPLVYCLEEVDNGKELFKIRAGSPRPDAIKVQYGKDLLEGATAITFTGKKAPDWKEDELYRKAAETSLPGAAACEEKELRWIPYYAWANRKSGEMTVWVNK